MIVKNTLSIKTSFRSAGLKTAQYVNIWGTFSSAVIIFFISAKAEQIKRTIIKLPADKKEYIVLYTTKDSNTFIMECITNKELRDSLSVFSNISEEEYEMSINYDKADDSANIEVVRRTLKVRKIDRAIGETLKQLYSYRCQICGSDFGKSYDTHVTEAHHIEYFVKSINNDSSNLAVICPNHHRVIHKTNPIFDRTNKTFRYPNGLEEKLTLNFHL